MKNAAWGVLSGVLGGGLQFLSVIVVARDLDVGVFGTYNYLLAFAILFQFLADFGLVNILVREIARSPEDVKHLLASAKGLMWLLFLCFLPVLAIAALLQDTPGDVKAQSFVMGIASLTLLQGVSYAAVLRAFEDMEFNSIGFILHKFALLGFTLVSLRLHWSIWGLVFANLAANLLLWFYYSQVVGWRFRLWVSLQRDIRLWKTMIGEAIPLGGGLLLRQIGWQLDSLLLYWLADSYSAGLFGGPYRLLLAVRLLSMILVLPLYPSLVRLAKTSLAEFSSSYQQALKWLICLSAPGAVLFVFAPDAVVRSVLGAKFIASTPALQWFGVAFVPMFVSALFPYVYTALGRQRVFFLVTGVTLVFRLGLELWLIPKFGYMSACIIASWCEVLPFGVFILVLGWEGIAASMMDSFLKPLIAALAMGGTIYLGQTYFGETGQLVPRLLTFVVSGIVYLAILFGTRCFSKGELAAAKEALNFLGPYFRSLRKAGTHER
ncbi:MAG: oligosaccharide flippase family protein [Verrucomicrobia bacterium]|nr:oligosaccharide flippase family protein [Verrucomicrobiota bacterium]